MLNTCLVSSAAIAGNIKIAEREFGVWCGAKVCCGAFSGSDSLPQTCDEEGVSTQTLVVYFEIAGLDS